MKFIILRKLSFFGHIIRKSRESLDKEIVEGTMPGTRARERPRTAWLDNIESWTGRTGIGKSIESNGGPSAMEDAAKPRMDG